MLSNDRLPFHIPAKRGMIGKYCILPGAPERVEQIAALLENPYRVGMNREFHIWNGYLEGEAVTVCSTGIGGPSTAIAVEELADCGGEVMLRVGTCGGISLSVECGDIVIASAAVRQDGTSQEYAPLEFPAVSDATVLMHLMRAAEQAKIRYHVGVVQSKDSFYGQHSPERMPTASALLEKWEAWKRLGVLASEMEASTLFTACAARGLRAGAVFHVIWNQERFLAGLDTHDNESHYTSRAIQAAVEAIRLMIQKDKEWGCLIKRRTKTHENNE